MPLYSDPRSWQYEPRAPLQSRTEAADSPHQYQFQPQPPSMAARAPVTVHEPSSAKVSELVSPRLHRLPLATGYFRVDSSVALPPSYASGSQTARPAVAAVEPSFRVGGRRDAFSRSAPLPSRTVVSADSAHLQLYHGHTFRRAADLRPLPPDYVRDPAVVPYVHGRANPRPFQLPPADEMSANAHSVRCFPGRALCPVTKYKENLLKHAIAIDF